MPDVAEGKPDSDDAETPEGVGIVRARDILGDLVLRAGFGNERIILTRNGKPTAAVVGMRDVERLRELDRANASAA